MATGFVVGLVYDVTMTTCYVVGVVHDITITLSADSAHAGSQFKQPGNETVPYRKVSYHLVLVGGARYPAID